MIKGILARILEGGVVDKRDVAREAGIQPETLDDIIRLLIQRGYLETQEDACEVNAACASCETRGSCQVIAEQRTYKVTERGLRYVRGSANE